MSATIEFKEVTQGDWLIFQAIGRIDTSTAKDAEAAALAEG